MAKETNLATATQQKGVPHKKHHPTPATILTLVLASTLLLWQPAFAKYSNSSSSSSSRSSTHSSSGHSGGYSKGSYSNNDHSGGYSKSGYSNSATKTEPARTRDTGYSNSYTYKGTTKNDPDITSKNKYSNSQTGGPAQQAPPKYANSATQAQQQGMAIPKNPDKKEATGATGALNKTITKEQSRKALADYEQQQTQFTQPSTAQSTTYSKYTNTGTFSTIGATYNPDTYSYRRQTYYAGYNPPAVVYQSYPRFGMWDALWWWFILDHLSEPRYSRMAYNYQQDPGYQQWRDEANRLSGENRELRDKLKALDEKNGQYAKANEPINPKYVPEGVDPDIMLSKQALDEATPPKKPSSSGGHYLLAALLILGTLGLAGGLAYMIRNKKGARNGTNWRI